MSNQTNNKYPSHHYLTCAASGLAFAASISAEAVMVMARRLLAAEAELQEYRKASPELKLANLINKFYERYPLSEFKSDGERAEALGYFMAGAELQCFGEFVKYEELLGDE